MHIKAIHQFSPSCNPGDGVTNGMLFTQRLLRELGFASEIYCDYVDPALAGEIHPLKALKPVEGDLLFMHHCLGYDNAAWLNELTIPKVMIYHNITPVHLLPEEGNVRRLSTLGRVQLKEWTNDYIGCIGDSEYNSIELRECGYRNVVTIPLLVDTGILRLSPWNPEAIKSLDDAINLLFIGRICENKRQIDLIDVLKEYMHFANQPVRLILAGGTSSEAYLQGIRARIRQHGLEPYVLMTGKVPDTTLHALYRIADAFVCMSEHEGFGMPLLEAMLFDVPVVARKSSAVPYTIGEGGLLLENDNPRDAAAALHLLMSEPAVRRRVIAAQRRNLERFDRNFIRSQLKEFLASLEIEAPNPPEPYVAKARPVHWQVEGPFDSSYSLAIVNREVARALRARNLQVGLRSMEGGGEFQPNDAFLAANPDCREMMEHCRHEPDVALRFCYPPTVNDMRGLARVVHSYGWEETGFPPAYADAFNRKLDLVTVLSREVEKILIDGGVRIPIAVSGGGVDHLLKIAPQPPAEKLRKFSFLHVSSCFPRKGVDALLAAYGKAFRRQDDVSLVIKTFPNPHNDIESRLARLRAEDEDYPDVVLINRDCSDAEVVGLYQACQAFVAPSRGEGLGLPMAEAMLFQLPVITTAWGGQRDFCNEQTAWLCDFRFAKAQTHLGVSHSAWAEPDVEHLASLLREVHALSPQQRQERTEAAYKLVSRDLTWDRVAQRIESAVDALSKQPLLRKEPKIGWISRWNTRCGIATYSEYLMAAFPHDRLTIFANSNSENLAEDQANVVRCWVKNWSPTDDEPMDLAFEEIVKRGMGAVVIQYHESFFTIPTLGKLIRRLKQAGIAVHCFFHSTAEFKRGEQIISLEPIASQLALCDRLYVHGFDDLNRLKSYGLVNNVTPFPHGVLPIPPMPSEDVRRGYALEGKKVIAAYGFLLPHKGVRQLIEAFAELARKDKSLHLLLLNALYPIPESEQEAAACRELIARLRLDNRVTMRNEFLPDDEVMTLLQLAEMVVYPYQETNESASGAVRMGLASGRAVVVTPLAIFDDVGEAAYRLGGTDSPSIAQGIGSLLAQPALLEQQRKKVGQWVAPRTWPLLSVRLLNIIDALANRLE